MIILENYLKSKRVKKALTTKPGEEGFSLVELVIVIAVLAILSAVAIPAFNNVQNNAKASAVQNGLVNGLKECAVKDAEGAAAADMQFADVASFSDANAFRGFTLAALADGAGGGNDRGADSCYAAQATGDAGMATFTIFLRAADGVAVKRCDNANLPGCSEKNINGVATITWD